MGKSNSARGRSPLQPAEQPLPIPSTLAVPSSGKARSKSRSRSRGGKKKTAKKSTLYKSDGVEDHDVFLLPGADFVVALGLTVAATVVRLYKIYQPTSVVFDEVQ